MRLLLSILAIASLALAQPNRVENFDTSGMPRRATNFVEQQLLDLIGHHQPGDLAEARRIQQKLGRYYADKGDERRANAAFLAAASADEGERPFAPANQPPSVAAPPSPVEKPPFTGNYYGMDGGTLHTWEFYSDGRFLHTWIAAGAGTNARSSERGAFRLAGSGTLELKLSSTATAFTTPGVGNRTTAIGGGSGSSSETRRLNIKFAEPNLVLDGLTLKPKSW
jgi:hypothetical protein